MVFLISHDLFLDVAFSHFWRVLWSGVDGGWCRWYDGVGILSGPRHLVFMIRAFSAANSAVIESWTEVGVGTAKGIDTVCFVWVWS